MTATKVRVQILEEKIAKLAKRLKKNAKRGVLEREERTKNESLRISIFLFINISMRCPQRQVKNVLRNV